MSLYSKLEKHKKILGIARNLRLNFLKLRKKRRTQGRYTFENRKKNLDTLCILLAGYKEYLWEDIFERLIKFTPKNIDFCIVSSGLYNEKLSKIAKENNWSYLSVKKNKVSLVQNIAIDLFESAKYIYKLDEDMFITEKFFSNLMHTYKEIEQEGRYNVGFVAPLIPINGYTNVKVLEKIGLLDDFDKKFGKAMYDSDSNCAMIKNPEYAKYMWGNTQEKLRNIDKIANDLAHNKFEYSVCPIRFSIGAILFKRDLWENMGRFRVKSGNNMGEDEIQICKYCMIESKAMIISENSIVGHFSFGPQTNEMKKYYEKNREIFKLK